MIYDRDLQRLRRGVVGLLLLNVAMCAFAAWHRAWIDTAAGAVWSITCCVWWALLNAQQRARDYARIEEAGLRELKRQLDRGEF